MKRFTLLLVLLGFVSAATAQTVTVGSKKFTESVILAEVAEGLLADAGFATSHRDQLGGTQFLWKALLAGDIDAYPDYTGTIRQEILADAPTPPGLDALRAALADQGIGITGSLGFNNTYAVGMQDSVAARLGISSLSDLTGHPGLTLGFSNEFMDRADGWPGLRSAYRLPHTATGLDHDLAYRGLASGTLDATDLYTTDAEIAYYNLRVLDDDRGFFPRYDAVFLYRLDLPSPAVAALQRLEGALPERTMVGLNAEAKLERRPEAAIAADFLQRTFAIATSYRPETRLDRLGQRTAEHLWLVLVSLAAAILLAIPLGVLAARYPRAGQVILGVVGVIYTIPALALLVFMIPLLGVGAAPAMVALFLYSLLPIVRNTHAGLVGINPGLRESAEALGLSAWARLWRIDLPLASPSMLAGIQTSAVINIGTATLGALIGAGGYGQPILTGIRLDDTSLILEGAVPAAALALLAQGLFALAERAVVPKGLRLG